ncbi:NAD(P)-dependent oxidoreductase [Subtercola lobariae]|uniref:Phosphoglycerate dehydrogenase n=1 Tax=Subtercola lobariae TaxID=1588641 RepID=A0A917B880_9MICO|nr:NAD(P)-dependent oxidoreductase [Subtercola lobariae]GGF31038.1 phosphoglycerate dehydrogenase [Subtercola lobariae]
MIILLPNTIDLDLANSSNPSIAGATAPNDDTVIVYDAKRPFADEHLAADVLVVWQNTPENLHDAATRLSQLRLVQTLAAGPDAALAAGFRDTVAIASGRSLHDGPVAEHALALILAAVRSLDELLESQREHEWNTAVNTAQVARATSGRYTLDRAQVTIWGFGSIAATLAPVLRMLGATVTGVASTTGIRHGFDVVAASDATELLARTDVLVSVLPASPETTDTFGAALFGALKPGAIFVNVGRGATVDEAALIDALESGQLRSAALDVTKVEPLPAESALWDAPHLILTPHIAGNRPQGAAGLVRANVEALHTGAALTNLVS